MQLLLSNSIIRIYMVHFAFSTAPERSGVFVHQFAVFVHGEGRGRQKNPHEGYSRGCDISTAYPSFVVVLFEAYIKSPFSTD